MTALNMLCALVLGSTVVAQEVSELTTSVLDVATTDGDLKGFQGGFSSGDYGYLMPYNNGAKFGKVARFNLASFSNVQVLDLTKTEGDLKGFWGGFSVGDYGYLVPNNNGKVARFNLATFSNVLVLDLTDTDGDLKGFGGGFSAGDYGYLTPYRNDAGYSGKVARFDLATFSNVKVLDLTKTDGDLKAFGGGFSSGDHGYLEPYKSGKVARFNLATFSNVQVLDLTETDGDLKGFDGGFTSGDYGYLVPYKYGASFGKVARFNLATFSNVQVLDLTKTDGDLKGFSGGFSSGGNGYLVPNNNGAKFGKVARFNLATSANDPEFSANDPEFSANDPENSANGACFHGNGTVLLKSGDSKRFSELSLGDFIKTSDEKGHFSFSPVLNLPHASNSEPASFLTLTTETGKMVDMTSDHIVPKCDLQEVTAGDLVVGDCVFTVDGKETLMEISSAAKTGVFTAITRDKFIVVGGIVASSFSKDSDPAKPELDYMKYRSELAEKRGRHLAGRMSKHRKRVQRAHAN